MVDVDCSEAIKLAADETLELLAGTMALDGREEIGWTSKDSFYRLTSIFVTLAKQRSGLKASCNVQYL
jgi:hypothetical protein